MVTDEYYQKLMSSKETRDSFLETIKERPIIAAHGDADGISSAVLLSCIREPAEVLIPRLFGDASNADIMVDMVPAEGFQGINIDHHPTQPDNPSYTLVWADIPSSLIVYTLFRDKISSDEWWKVAIGCVGDGQEARIPVEVWDRWGELLEQEIAVGFGYMKKDKDSGGGGMYAYLNPVWYRISSNVNMACRVGKGEIAYRIARNASTPFDLISDPALLECRKKVNSEIVNIMKEQRPIDIKGKVEYWAFTSDIDVASLLATRLYGKSKVTTIAINQTTGKFSIRGVLSPYLVKKLEPFNIATMGGHLGFIGANMNLGKSSKDLLDSLRKIL